MVYNLLNCTDGYHTETHTHIRKVNRKTYVRCNKSEHASSSCTKEKKGTNAHYLITKNVD